MCVKAGIRFMNRITWHISRPEEMIEAMARIGFPKGDDQAEGAYQVSWGLYNVTTETVIRRRRQKLCCHFGGVQKDRSIHTAQVQIPLGKGDLNIRLSESPVNFLVNL